MKIGDLISVPSCEEYLLQNKEMWPCDCYFCYHGMPYDRDRVGVVIGKADTHGAWSVMFECGRWTIFEKEAEIISG